MNNPVISVILPTYNGASKGFINDAVNSVLSQSYINFELIIIDDGSTDDTKKYLKNYLKNKKVRYFYQKNRGRSSARNLGIKKSLGKYICFLDDDDVWKKEKLKKQISFFSGCKDKKAGLLSTWMEIIDRDKKNIGYKIKNVEGNVYKEIFYDNMINCSAVMVKKEIFKKAGYFDTDFPVRQDWDMWIRAAKFYNVYQLKEYLVQYRVHDSNVSNNYFKTAMYGEKVLLKNLSDKSLDQFRNDILGNFYFEQAENFYAIFDFKNFRKYLLNGIKNSFKRFKILYFRKIIFSFIPIFLFKKLKG